MTVFDDTCNAILVWFAGFSQVRSLYQEGLGGSPGVDVTGEARPVQSWAEPLEESSEQKRPVEVEQIAYDGQKKTWGHIELGNSACVSVCVFVWMHVCYNIQICIHTFHACCNWCHEAMNNIIM